MTHLCFCLFCMFLFFTIYLFVFIFSVFFCAVHWISHHIPRREKKNPKSKLQNPDQASKLVCPTRSAQQVCLPTRLPNSFAPKDVWTPSYHSFWWKNWAVCPICFFSVIKAAVFYMEFWFMTGLPQESRRLFGKFISTVSKMSSWKSPKKLQSLAHKRFGSQTSGTKKWMGKISREFCLRV